MGCPLRGSHRSTSGCRFRMLSCLNVAWLRHGTGRTQPQRRRLCSPSTWSCRSSESVRLTMFTWRAPRSCRISVGTRSLPARRSSRRTRPVSPGLRYLRPLLPVGHGSVALRPGSAPASRLGRSRLHVPYRKRCCRASGAVRFRQGFLADASSACRAPDRLRRRARRKRSISAGQRLTYLMWVSL